MMLHSRPGCSRLQRTSSSPLTPTLAATCAHRVRRPLHGKLCINAASSQHESGVSPGGQRAAAVTPPVQNGSTTDESSSLGAPPGLHKLTTEMDEIASKYEALDRRLDSLETTLLTLLRNVKQRVRKPSAAAAVGHAGETPAQGGLPTDAMSSQDVPEYDYDEEGEGEDEDGGIFDLKKLQTSLVENVNKGYMESVKHLRDMLMAYEWDLHGKELAGRKGVAQFEQYVVEKDLPGVSFEALSQLYADPNNLDALPNDKLKLLARSIIQQVMDDRYCSIYLECTNTAKELAHTGLKDLIPDSAGKVGGVLKDMLPVPGFLKK